MNKLLTTSLVGAGILAGAVGGMTFDTPVDATVQEQLDAKTEEATYYKDAAEQQQVGKVLTGRDYITSQVTTGRTPVFTGAMSSDEVSLAYIEAYHANGGNVDALAERIKSGEKIDMQAELVLLAKSKGEFLTCTK